MNETPRVSLQKRFERNYPLLWTNLSRLNGLAIDLNKFSPNEKKVEISSIFKWFKQDFDQAGGVQKILGRYAPEPVREFAATGNYETKYLPYNWGLNDQGPHGRNYSRAQLSSTTSLSKIRRARRRGGTPYGASTTAGPKGALAPTAGCVLEPQL